MPDQDLIHLLLLAPYLPPQFSGLWVSYCQPPIFWHGVAIPISVCMHSLQPESQIPKLDIFLLSC